MYTSQNFTGVMKSRIMRWTGHVTCTREMRNRNFQLENLKGRYHLGNVSINEDIKLDVRYEVFMVVYC
jgi:hypothetical protein